MKTKILKSLIIISLLSLLFSCKKEEEYTSSREEGKKETVETKTEVKKAKDIEEIKKLEAEVAARIEQEEAKTDTETEKEETEKTETEAKVKKMRVNTDILNMRTMPNQTSEILIQLEKDKEVTVLEDLVIEGANWVKIKVDNLEGYVMKEYLGDI